MRRHVASINDLPIKDNERKYDWPLGRCPDDHPSLSDLGLWTIEVPLGDSHCRWQTAKRSQTWKTSRG
jgi:hypothetical protein